MSTLDRIDKRYSDNQHLLATNPQISHDPYGTAKAGNYGSRMDHVMGQPRTRPDNLVLQKSISQDNEAEYASLRRKKFASASQVPSTPKAVPMPSIHRIPFYQSE